MCRHCPEWGWQCKSYSEGNGICPRRQEHHAEPSRSQLGRYRCINRCHQEGSDWQSWCDFINENQCRGTDSEYVHAEILSNDIDIGDRLRSNSVNERWTDNRADFFGGRKCNH